MATFAEDSAPGGKRFGTRVAARKRRKGRTTDGAARTGADGGDRSPTREGVALASTPPLQSAPDNGRDRLPLVIVAEDEDGSRMALCEILRDGGYRTLGARDGLELVRLATSLHPDAVLLDLAMPNLNGMEAASALRSAAQTSGIRVIAVTASWLGERTDLLSAAGFDGALRKPCSGADLLQELRRVLPPGMSTERAAD